MSSSVTSAPRKGLLALKGSGLKIDTKKKFVVFSVYVGYGMLWYYPKEYQGGPEPPIDVIALKDADVVNNNKAGDKAKEKEDLFTIKINLKLDKKFSIVVSCDSESDKQEWMEALQDAVDSTSSKIFETTIKDAALKTNGVVPPFIRSLWQLLEKQFATEGIFRVSGNANRIAEIKNMYNAGEEIPTKEFGDPHLITGIIKLFFRELTNPLLTYAKYNQFLALGGADAGAGTLQKIKQEIASLPEVNRVVLGFLMKNLKRVSAFAAQSKMEASNLSIVFGPTILRQQANKAKIDELSSMSAGNKLCEILIVEADKIFDPADEKLYDSSPRGPRALDIAPEYPELIHEERAAMEPVLIQHKENMIGLFAIRVFKKNEKSKGEDTESILVVGANRVYLFARGGKLDVETHYIDLVEVISPNPLEVKFIHNVNSKPQEFTVRPFSYCSWDIDIIVRQILAQADVNFVGMPQDQRFKTTIGPADRDAQIRASLPVPDTTTGCGGFVRTYQTVCDYFGIAVQEDITWDLDNLYYNNDIKSFNLSEFVRKDRNPADDFKALMYSLRYNTWFNSLICDGQKLGADVIQIASIMQTNKTIRTLRLANVGATNTSIDKLSESLKANVGLALEELDVSGNPLEDKSIIALSSALERFTGLGVLNISNCQLKTKGMSALMQALQKNTQVCSTLHTLNIAGNSLDNQECSRNLGLFIGKAVALKTLNLTGTSPQCLYMCSTFEKNHSITTVYLSDFKVNAKAVDDLVLFLKQMPLLMDLNLSNVTIPVDKLIEILHSHPALVSLDFSDNELTDDGIDALGLYFQSQDKSLCIEELTLNRAFGKIKNKGVAINTLGSILDSRPIRKLKIQGGTNSRLKGDLINLILGIINNKTIEELDVMGHQCGDSLALVLGKVLQHNKVLSTLYWDDNTTTLNGLKVFKIGLERNSSLRKMPLPLLDMALILKSTPDSELSSVVELTNQLQQHVFDNAIRHNADGPRSKSLKSSEGLEKSTDAAPSPPGASPTGTPKIVRRKSATRQPSMSKTEGVGLVRSRSRAKGDEDASGSGSVSSNGARKKKEKGEIDRSSLNRASVVFGQGPIPLPSLAETEK